MKIRVVRKVRIHKSTTEPAGVMLASLSKVFSYRRMTEDLLLALRYCYYVLAKPLVPDPMYDSMEKKFMESGKCPKDSPLHQCGSDRQEDYLPHVRALALYLMFAAYHSKVGQKQHEFQFAGTLGRLRKKK
jgi:hypothetical protein